VGVLLEQPQIVSTTEGTLLTPVAVVAAKHDENAFKPMLPGERRQMVLPSRNVCSLLDQREQPGFLVRCAQDHTMTLRRSAATSTSMTTITSTTDVAGMSRET
jgi:hypothetical protein